MDTHSRLRQLMTERNWTAYRLAKESGLSESTLANIFKHNTVPSIATLEAVCSAFGISLAQFFAEGEMAELTPELKELFDHWISLTPKQKQAALQMLQAMHAKNPVPVSFRNGIFFLSKHMSKRRLPLFSLSCP